MPVDELEEAAAAAPDGTAPLRCPPKVRKDLVGPDITGLRPGMTREEALSTVRCTLGEGAVVTEEKRWLDRLDTYGVELGTQFFTVEKGSYRPCNFAREWQDSMMVKRAAPLGESETVRMLRSREAGR